MWGTIFEASPRSISLLTAGGLILALLGVMAPASYSAPKAKPVAVTFHANGGTIGAKKQTIRKEIKGKSLGKLPGAKRVAYKFTGWYTKKAGGTKATSRTRVRKKTTFYARWKRVLTANEKKLIGEWSSGPTTAINNSYRWIRFKADGAFIRTDDAVSPDYQHFERVQGLWRVKGDRIVATNIFESVKWFTNNVPQGERNRRIADQSWPYFFDDRRSDGAWAEEGLTWLHINHFPGKGGFDLYGYDYVKPTLVGQ